MTAESSDEAIVAFLKDHPGCRTSEIAQAVVGRSEKSCRIFLYWLLKSDQVTVERKGHTFEWRLKG